MKLKFETIVLVDVDIDLPGARRMVASNRPVPALIDDLKEIIRESGTHRVVIAGQFPMEFMQQACEALITAGAELLVATDAISSHEVDDTGIGKFFLNARRSGATLFTLGQLSIVLNTHRRPTAIVVFGPNENAIRFLKPTNG